MTQPKVLMLDEPTAGVSPIVMDELFGLDHRSSRTGLPILMSLRTFVWRLKSRTKAMSWCWAQCSHRLRKRAFGRSLKFANHSSEWQEMDFLNALVALLNFVVIPATAYGELQLVFWGAWGTLIYGIPNS